MTSVFEGVPYVIYESLAMEVPVVAPALPGNVEFMDDDSGVIVDPRDDADAVRQRGRGPARRRGTTTSARRSIARGEWCATSRSPTWRAATWISTTISCTPARPQGAPGAGPSPNRCPTRTTARAAPARLAPAARPDVAVIVPCYQHGRYLPECVASIRAQTLRPSRSSSSTTGRADPETETALRELERSDDVTVIRQDVNRGPSAARNRALDEVTRELRPAARCRRPPAPDRARRHGHPAGAAPPDVGFVYPNAQHFGNRNDYVEVPAYNLHLLLLDNYCPATSLFDRRVFDAGVSYDEEIVFGHEDWDIVLQLAERGCLGAAAHGPTFKYRRRGFSRVNAVEYGPESFHEEIERRHPSLYAPAARARIKARWAPALSIVLIDEGGIDWSTDAVAPLGTQTCDDFEIIAGRPLEAPGIHASVEIPRTPGRPWLDPALAAARGRWVVVAISGSCSGVRALHLRGGGAALLLGLRCPMRRVRRRARAAAPLVLLAQRSRRIATCCHRVGQIAGAGGVGGRGPRHHGVRGRGPSALAPAARAGALALAADPRRTQVGLHTTGRRLSRWHGDRPLGFAPAPGKPTAWVRERLAWEAPSLPGLAPGTVRRWEGMPTWQPPETVVLCRHRALDRPHWIVTNRRDPPDGYVLEYDLGLLQHHEQPGTRRLIERRRQLREVTTAATRMLGRSATWSKPRSR